MWRNGNNNDWPYHQRNGVAAISADSSKLAA